MLMLRDKSGKVVVLKKDDEQYTFWAIDGDKLEQTQEATICVGKEVRLTDVVKRKIYDDAGFPNLPLNRDFYQYGQTTWNHNGRGIYSVGGSGRSFFLGDKEVTEDIYIKCSHVFYDTEQYNGLEGNHDGMKIASILEMIGVGNNITIRSLLNHCKADQTTPRIVPGQTVCCVRKKVEKIGVVRKTDDKVVVEFEDGSIAKYKYEDVSASKIEMKREPIDPTLEEGFAFALKKSKSRLYRAKTIRERFVAPIFPAKGDKPIAYDNTQTCVCPVCGWKIGLVTSWRSAESALCNCCGISGKVVEVSETEVTLLLNPIPKKNTFQIKEARCCDNCGVFEFAYGRQGKRSTGYCTVNNCCVQGFTTCDAWFPRNSDRYDQNMKQHLTNLHYGVKDARNTERPEIDDVVFKESDYLNERKRADKAKGAYLVACREFEQAIKEEASKVKFVEDMSQEEIDAFKENLK